MKQISSYVLLLFPPSHFASLWQSAGQVRACAPHTPANALSAARGKQETNDPPPQSSPWTRDRQGEVPEEKGGAPDTAFPPDTTPSPLREPKAPKPLCVSE